MNSRLKPGGKGRLTVREIAALAIMGALMFATQVAMAALPNIHLVAVFVILTTLFFGWRALYSVLIFDMLEGLVYGFGLWWVSYLYIWTMLVLVVMLLRKNKGSLFWACIAAIYGLCFGALCALPYLFIGGVGAAFSYWLSGIPFDLIHCGGNFVLTLVLLKPLYKAMVLATGADKS